MADGIVQIDVVASAEGAEAGFNQVATAAEGMARKVENSAGQAGKSVDSIGQNAVKSADQFNSAEGRMSASIKRATTNLELLGKTASQKLEFQIGQKGLDAAKFEPMLAKLRELEAANTRVGMSAAQTAAALRNVPAQFTDIAVSLASGQKPMTVLLQQGGQLKDMFGGVGAAAKAVGGYVASLINPVTLAAAAVGGLGYAFYSGAAEADEFRKNLILTGNASGLTTDKFNAMAQSMANIGGITRGAAAEALTAMAASGNIGAESIERLTKTAIQFEKAGGPAVAETVKQFEALGKEPVKASVELSEKTHYLTLAVYEQIKSLEEQGKSSEAAALAQKTWADALDQRTPQMVQNLGYLETALDNIKRSAAGAWDWVKDIGRDSTSAEMIYALKNKIAEADKDIASGSINSNRLKQQREQWKSELAELVAANIAKEGEAKRHADAQKKEEARIAATAGADKLIESQRSKREQYSAELKKLDEQRTGDLISEEKYQQAKAALAKKYEEKPKASKADKVENAYQSILDSLNKQLGSAEKLNAVEKLNVELQEKKYAKLNPAQKENLLLIAQQIDMQKRAEAEGKATLQWIADGADAQKKSLKSLNDELEKSIREVATYGMRRGEIAEYDLRLIDEQIAAERALNAEIGVGSSEVLRQLELQRSKRQEILGQARKLDQLDAGKKAAEEAKRAAEEAAAAWQKTIDRIDQTFHDSFTRMLENGRADWDAFGKSLATSFKTAVADEIYKLTIKPIVVSVVSSFAGGAAQAAGAAAGQSGSGIGGVVQGVQSAYGAYNSGISNAATAFATSGMGQYMGLSTTSAAGAMGPPTAEGAYGYTAGGTALTSSGSSFVSSAGPYAAALAAMIYGDNLMKAGWGLDNNRKGYAASAVGATAGGVIAGMAAGASSGASAGSTVGPWGTVIGAVVGAIAVPVLSRLFGHNRNTNADATGVQGTFDLGGFTGNQWQQFSKKGGTFRSDRRWTDPFEVAPDIDKALDSSFKQAVAKMQEMGKTLGVETVKSIDGFTHEFSLQLSDNGDMSKAGEKLAAEITKAADEIAARMVPNIDEFKRLGETASQTFERLNNEVKGTDAILLAMGKDAAAAFGGVGLSSIAAREALIDLAGGLDQLSSKTQFFYGNFYDANEQLHRAADQAQKVLDKGFADLGLSLPTDRKGFRDLVESYGKDLSTESSRKYFNALLDLQDEFNAVAKEAESTSDKLKQATAAAQTSQGSIFDTFASDAQKLDAAKKIVNDAFSSIGRAVPDSAASFLELSQSLVPTDKASQDLINTLAKVSNAFAYVEKSVADTAAGITASANAAAASRRSVMDSYDPASAVTRAQADINAAFAKYGATAPTDRAGLAAVAQSIDTNTALGREQMAALQALTGSFDTVFAARSQATSSQRSLQDSFDPSGAVARAQSDIAVAFGKYGATAPTDRAGVAAVASSIDTNTALGKQQMAELAALSGAFDTVFSAQEKASQMAADAAKTAADEQARAAQAALDAAQRAADEQARIAQQAAEEQMRLATQVHDSISGALKSLLGQSQQFEAQSRQMAQATLQSALVIAKAGGSLINFQGLDAALETVTKLDKATFATATGYAVEFGRTANLLTQLEQYTRINGSHANGLDYVPFDGYIAQLHRGERVQTAASASAADATVEEVKALRSDLNAIGAALAAYTQKTAKILAKLDVEGIATRV